MTNIKQLLEDYSPNRVSRRSLLCLSTKELETLVEALGEAYIAIEFYSNSNSWYGSPYLGERAKQWMEKWAQKEV